MSQYFNKITSMTKQHFGPSYTYHYFFQNKVQILIVSAQNNQNLCLGSITFSLHSVHTCTRINITIHLLTFSSQQINLVRYFASTFCIARSFFIIPRTLTFFFFILYILFLQGFLLHKYNHFV